MREDVIQDRRTIIDAEALTKAVAEVTPENCARIRLGDDPVELPLNPGELSGLDQLEVLFDQTGSGEFSLSVALVTDRHTPGLSVPDQYSIGAQGSGDAEDGRVVLPMENFLIYGYPKGWHEVVRILLWGDGNLVLRRIDGVKRQRAQGPRLTDEEFFDGMLDLSVPGLGKVKQASDAGDYAAAGSELTKHLRSRSSPVHRYRTRAEPVAGFDTTEADHICRHFINGHQLSDPIDWRANPEGYLEWMHAFNRHFFLAVLLEAYLATGNENYAAKLDYFLSTWIKSNPHPVGNNGGGDPAWETLSTACRAAYQWMPLFFGTLHSEAFSDRTRIDMLKSLCAHADHLVRYQGYANNWRIVEAQAILTVGVMFPEIKRASAWREVGTSRLVEEMKLQVWPDGVQQEVSPGYHWMCGRAFVAMRNFCRDNGWELPESFERTVERMADYVLFLTRPDGSLPSLNDSGGVTSSRRRHPALGFGAEELGRSDMLYIMSGRKQGSPPQASSYAFPDAGIFVQRSDWGERANWLVFRAGRTGRAHCHEDKLSFELAALGSLILVDPGIASYQNDPWTRFFRSAAGHNVALVDGLSPNQIGRLRREEKVQSSRNDVRWAGGRVMDYASGVYADGYGPPEGGLEGVQHRREIVFVRPGYWLLLDSFLGEGRREVELLFHFMPMRVLMDGAIVRTDRLAKPNLELVPLWPEPPRVELVCGRNDPVQGWIALDGVVPAPVASLKTAGALPLCLATLLMPYDSAGGSGVVVRRSSVPGGTGLEIRHPDGSRDLLKWRRSGVDASRAHTDARLAFLRLSPSAEVLSAAILDGSYLRHDGTDVIRLSKTAQYHET